MERFFFFQISMERSSLNSSYVVLLDVNFEYLIVGLHFFLIQDINFTLT